MLYNVFIVLRFHFFFNLLIIILWAMCIGLVSNLYVLLLIGNFNYYRITINDKKKKVFLKR